MIESLLKVSRDLTICEFDFYRAQKAELLAEDFDVKICKDWKKAIDDAFDWDGTLFITGSLYFISQVRPYLLEKLESDK
jgi:dihydrofolate synthase/folylpolyglutamate synthase